MAVHILPLLRDPRMIFLAATHSLSTPFHTPAWRDALHSTYGYEPFFLTACPRHTPLTNAIVLCRVRSWVTGNRLVSLPFADHCDPLVDTTADRTALIDALEEEARKGWKYVELRPTEPHVWDDPRLQKSAEFKLHILDLRPSVDDLFRGTHPSTVQRKIRRAEREGLTWEEGRSDVLLDAFFCLMVMTRRRHGVPPQPIEWFRNLIACMGDALMIRVAYKDARPIGSILTLQHRDTLTYKYGCSDARFHGLGTMPFLFWKAIEDAKGKGLTRFDLGRSDLSNTGLIAFKERLGAAGQTLTYYRLGAKPVRLRPWKRPLLRRALARLPDPLFVKAGRLLYRHMG